MDRPHPRPAGISRAPRTAPDAALAAAGFEGEQLVARVRLIVTAMLLITPAWKLVVEPAVPIFRWGFGVTACGFAAALGVAALLRSGRYSPWVGFASSVLDVSLVSAALWIFAFIGSPLVALNSKVTFEIYFLAITATALRYDRRICLVAGAAMLAEYAGLVLFCHAHWDLNDPALGVVELGGYSDVDQVTRLILLVAAVLLAYALVRRGHRLLDLSLRDRLTGLYNRAFLERFLDAESERSARYGHGFAVAMLDADHFKSINDQHGHATGDVVLRALANRLKRGLREADVVARWGGEEFAIVLPETTPRAALALLERLRREVKDAPIAIPGGVLNVAFSAGIACAPADGRGREALLAVADARLLAAKRAGRDRIVA